MSNKLQFQLTYIYYAPKNIPQGRQYARSSLDIGLKKAVLKGKGEMQFSFIDILNQFGIKQDIQGEGFSALYENYFETQVVRIGMTYKFYKIQDLSSVQITGVSYQNQGLLLNMNEVQAYHRADYSI